MKRINLKHNICRETSKKVVANEKIIPTGNFCYEPIKGTDKIVYDEFLEMEVTSMKIKICPYLKPVSEEECVKGSYRCECSLLGIFIDEHIKLCGIKHGKYIEDE